ncbi:type III PLP-dependent enzyme [Dactylosporangium sp. CA-139114]|uniref:type III PLP-dependent enzyme n=1 Tax=Dactylosporangium sp. CA-139114 TaxID=3239931 RepID=UPI003D983A93
MSAPRLVLDLARVGAAYRAMRAALPDVAVHYAMKCNPHPRVVGHLAGLGCGFEIASAAELDQLLALGVPAAGVLFSNPVKPESHIARAFAAGVRRFAFDSADELAKLGRAAPGASVYVRIAVPDRHSEVPSEGKFGVDLDTAAQLLLDARDRGLDPHGVTFHVGSQMLHPRAWEAPLELVGELMDKLSAEDVRLRLVDLGGGFPARYDGDPPPLGDYAAVIHAGLRALPYPVDAVVEPGRALVAEAGTLIATVIGVADRNGRRWVHLDVGAFNGLMESLETGNRLRFPVRDELGRAERRLCQLTGPTCDSQDTILFDVELSHGLATGHRVYLHSAGAYTTVYASGFNGFEPPAVDIQEIGDQQ